MIISNIFFVSNYTIHTDLKINTKDETAKILYKRSRFRLTNYLNQLVSSLGFINIRDNFLRRLRKNSVKT